MTPPVVMIHGMLSRGHHWDLYKRYFAGRGYDVHTPTLRHHDVDPAAPAPAGLGATSLLDYAADLEALIAGLDRKPILIGHSMGGLLVQILAGRGLAEMAVLLTPASPRGIVALTPSVIRTFIAPLSRWGFWRKPFRLSYGAARYGMLNRFDEPDARALYGTMVDESGRAAAEIAYWMFDGQRANEADAAATVCPVLVIAGRRDRATPASVVRKVARRYGPRATYHEYPDNGHWVLSEPGWQTIAETCETWIRRNLEGTPHGG